MTTREYGPNDQANNLVVWSGLILISIHKYVHNKYIV